MTFEEIIKIKETGIYKIINNISKKAYIGQAKRIGHRVRSHLTSTFNPAAKDYSYPIHKSIRKYGLDAFDFEILELCDIQKLNEQEKYWINYYDTRNKGYNQTDGGNQSIRHIKLTKEEVKLIILELLAGKTNNEIANKFNVSANMISKINTGVSWHDPSLTYPIRISTTEILSVSYANCGGYCVCQYSKDNKLLNKFTSTHIAAQKIFNDDRICAHIAECARGERKSIGGFIWKREKISEEEWLMLRKKENNIV